MKWAVAVSIGLVKRHAIEVRIFFSLNQLGLPAMLIDCQLSDDRAQPPAQGSYAGIVRKLSAGPAILARFKAV
jgi:hypothetical protein